MHTLYPAIKPYARYALEVEDGHELYVEESGSKDGIPVLFLHGGPGMACDKHSRRYFDPDIYRIVLFDQRGTGRSSPHADITCNNTQGLLKDIEKIRETLDIEKWVIFGGSWGALLGLVYAQSQPDRVLGMVLRGTLLGRQKDLDWIYKDGVNRVFPDYWKGFVEHIPVAERDDLIAAYGKRLEGSDEIARMAAAKAWTQWEGHCSSLRPNQNLLDSYADPYRVKSMARLQCHYFKNKFFIEENQIIAQMPNIAHIPAILVHGRYDMVSPLAVAHALNDLWPASNLHIVRDAGHSAMEPSISDALIRATDEMARDLRPDIMPDEG